MEWPQAEAWTFFALVQSDSNRLGDRVDRIRPEGVVVPDEPDAGCCDGQPEGDAPGWCCGLESDQATDRYGDRNGWRETRARSEAMPTRTQPRENSRTRTSQPAIIRPVRSAANTAGTTCASQGTAKPSNHMSPARAT